MGTGTAVFLIIVFVLCVLFLIPIRANFRLGDGHWDLTVKYLWLRLYHKESAPPKEPELPPKPDPQADTPAPESQNDSITAAEASVNAEEKPQKKQEKKRKTKKEASADDKPKKKKKPTEDHAEGGTEDGESDAEKPPKKKGFIKRLKPQGFHDVVETVKDVLDALSPSLRFLFRHFHFRHVKLYLAVGSDDPADTAQLYGRICAGAYPLLGTMQNLLDLEVDEFRILADFFGDSMTVRTSLELRVSPAALVLTVLILGIRFLWRAWLRFRREDREEKRYAEETKPLSQNPAV